MFANRRHLSDPAMVELYFACAGRATVGGAGAAHLEACTACHARYQDLAARLDSVAEDAVCEADAEFTADRLRDQRARVLHRLESLGRHARVIRFPAGGSPAGPVPVLRRIVIRWTAAAAAAGLLVGAVAERALTPRFDASRREPAVTRTDARLAPQQDPTAPEREDLFLSEVEEALSGNRIVELQALDALVPTVQSASTAAR